MYQLCAIISSAVFAILFVWAIYPLIKQIGRFDD